jgi:hypothetical protein
MDSCHQVVREAIDRQYEQLANSARGHDAEAIIKEIHEEYPDPAGLPPRRYDVHKGGQARKVNFARVNDSSQYRTTCCPVRFA